MVHYREWDRLAKLNHLSSGSYCSSNINNLVLEHLLLLKTINVFMNFLQLRDDCALLWHLRPWCTYIFILVRLHLIQDIYYIVITVARQGKKYFMLDCTHILPQWLKNEYNKDAKMWYLYCQSLFPILL